MSRYRPCTAVADVLAYLEQRRMNCVIIAERDPHERDRATIMRQQLDVVLSDLRAGLHEGAVAVCLNDDPHDLMEV